MEYVFRKRKDLVAADIQLAEELLVNNSWWDTVDFIAANIVGWMVSEYPELKRTAIPVWMRHENMWLRRTSLIYQLKYREETDTEILSEAIHTNLESREFFINKAIGWALRQYSKYNPDWVRSFIENTDLQPLSHREASKYI
jgi:3-methyladenine DNA glycosylase AlkD